jgi:hypothetical protein
MASSPLKDMGHLTKFDGTNFTRWQEGLMLILEQHELLPIINGTEVKPSEVNIIIISKDGFTRKSFLSISKRQNIKCNHIPYTLSENSFIVFSPITRLKPIKFLNFYFLSWGPIRIHFLFQTKPTLWPSQDQVFFADLEAQLLKTEPTFTHN